MTLTVSGESPGLSRPVCSGEAGTSQEQQGRQDEEGFFFSHTKVFRPNKEDSIHHPSPKQKL